MITLLAHDHMRSTVHLVPTAATAAWFTPVERCRSLGLIAREGGFGGPRRGVEPVVEVGRGVVPQLEPRDDREVRDVLGRPIGRVDVVGLLVGPDAGDIGAAGSPALLGHNGRLGRGRSLVSGVGGAQPVRVGPDGGRGTVLGLVDVDVLAHRVERIATYLRLDRLPDADHVDAYIVGRVQVRGA